MLFVFLGFLQLTFKTSKMHTNYIFHHVRCYSLHYNLINMARKHHVYRNTCTIIYIFQIYTCKRVPRMILEPINFSPLFSLWSLEHQNHLAK